MPELPEVETLARDLRAAAVGRTITEAWVSPDAPRLVQEMPVEAFTSGLRGRRIEEPGDTREVGLERLHHRWRIERRRRVEQRVQRDGAVAKGRFTGFSVHLRYPIGTSGQ